MKTKIKNIEIELSSEYIKQIWDAQDSLMKSISEDERAEYHKKPPLFFKFHNAIKAALFGDIQDLLNS